MSEHYDSQGLADQEDQEDDYSDVSGGEYAGGRDTVRDGQQYHDGDGERQHDEDEDDYAHGNSASFADDEDADDLPEE